MSGASRSRTTGNAALLRAGRSDWQPRIRTKAAVATERLPLRQPSSTIVAWPPSSSRVEVSQLDPADALGGIWPPEARSGFCLRHSSEPLASAAGAAASNHSCPSFLVHGVRMSIRMSVAQITIPSLDPVSQTTLPRGSTTRLYPSDVRCPSTPTISLTTCHR